MAWGEVGSQQPTFLYPHQCFNLLGSSLLPFSLRGRRLPAPAPPVPGAGSLTQFWVAGREATSHQVGLRAALGGLPRSWRGRALRTTTQVATVTNALPATARQGQGRWRSGQSTHGLQVQETLYWARAPCLARRGLEGVEGGRRGSHRARDPHSRPGDTGRRGEGEGRRRASGGCSGLGLGKQRVVEVAPAGALGVRLPGRGLRGWGAESGAGAGGRRARPGEARTVPTAPSPALPCTSGSGSPGAALPARGPPRRASSTCG